MALFRRGLRRAAVIALFATAGLAGVGSPAAAANDTIPALGINDLRSDGIFLHNAGYNGAQDLDVASSAGVGLYRARVRLDCVDPGHTGTFDFTKRLSSCAGLNYDDLVGGLAARGMTLLPVLMNFAPGADGSIQPSPPTPDGANGTASRAEFAAFAAALAGRYGPAGSYWASCNCTPLPVHAWEIWNEENNGWWWNGTASAEDYAAVFAQTRAGLRSADPQARTVVGGFTFDPNGQPSFVAPAAFISALAANNANAFDAVAVHPYTDVSGKTADQLGSSAMGQVDWIADAVKRATGPSQSGGTRQQIWITEMGWADETADPSTIAQGLAAFLDKARGSADNLGPVLWYMLRDAAGPAGRDDHLGLRLTAADGSDAGPKPAWGVFADAAASAAPVALPAALADAAPYVAPAPAAPYVAPAPDSTVAFARVVNGTKKAAKSCTGADRVTRKGATTAARRAILCLVNAARAKRGLAPIKLDSVLSKRSAHGAHAARKARAAREAVWLTTAHGSKATPRKIVARWLRNLPRRRQLLGSHTRVGLAVVATRHRRGAVYALAGVTAAPGRAAH